MKIGQALKLKIGDIVRYPADRGSKPGTGRVSSISKAVNTNIYGVEYVWIGVRYPRGSNHVWPSNRLS